TAVRLAQQVNGVSHVVSKLDYPIEGEQGSSEFERGLASNGGEQSNELSRTSFEASNNDRSGVMQAYEQQGRNQGAQLQQSPMPQMRTQRAMAPQGRRGNMPVPFRPINGVLPNRHGMPNGVQQASCPCNGGGGGAGMMMGG